MDTNKLREIVKNHELWLESAGTEGTRANLDHADLTDLNLIGINLRHANLVGANMQGINLRRANLAYADLSDADLTHANLIDANMQNANLAGTYLIGANMAGADLTQANLAGAHMTGANMTNALLTDANLIGTRLTNTNLTGTSLIGTNLADTNIDGTCLDAHLHKLQRAFCKQCPPIGKHGGRIVYRTATSQFIGLMRYEPGNTYVAPHLSFSTETECHPGIYAASSKWMLTHYPNAVLVKCYVRDGDWVISAKGAIRCKRIRVLSY